MPKVSDADLAYYAKFGGVSDIPDIARELIARLNEEGLT